MQGAAAATPRAARLAGFAGLAPRRLPAVLVHVALAAVAVAALWAVTATALDLTAARPQLGLLIVGTGHVAIVDPDGAAAQAGIQQGDRITAIDRQSISAATLQGVRDASTPDVLVSEGSPGSFALFRVQFVPASATELSGEVVALVVAALLWLCGLYTAVAGRRSAVSRLYAAAALLAAFAGTAVVAAQMGLAWANTLYGPAAVIALTALVAAQLALASRPRRVIVVCILASAAMGLLALAIAVLQPDSVAGPSLAMADLAALSVALVAVPLLGSPTPSGTAYRARQRVFVAGVVFGLVPLWVGLGAPTWLALYGRGMALPATWHLSALWGLVGLVPMGLTYAALAARCPPHAVERGLLVGTSYLLAGCAGLAVLAITTTPGIATPGLAVSRPGAIVAALAALALLRVAIGRDAARAPGALQADYAEAARIVAEGARAATSEADLAHVLERRLPGPLRVARVALVISDPTQPDVSIDANTSDEPRVLLSSAMREAIMSASAPVWLFNDAIDSSAPAREDAAWTVWIPVWWDGAPAGVLGLGPFEERDSGAAAAASYAYLAATIGCALYATRLAASLRERTDALVAVSQRLSLAHERERAGLARELHDVVAQELIALTRHLRRYGEGSSPPPAIWADMLAGAQDALLATRRICNGLRPSLLDLGIVPALRDLIAAESERHAEVEIGLSIEGTESRLNGDVEFALFRIAQESLHNALSHAQAHRLHVAVSFVGGVSITVRDDGVGFKVPDRYEDLPGDHLGLIGMRERAKELGGQLDVASTPGRGTVVSVRLPTPKS